MIIECKYSFPVYSGPWGGVDLHSCSTQPDMSLHCRTTDMCSISWCVCLLLGCHF